MPFLAFLAREALELAEAARARGDDVEADRQFRIEELADELADLLEVEA